MGKFSYIPLLGKEQQDNLFIRFAKCVAALRNSVEAANFIKDLLSESESIMLARRLWIADLLEQGYTYKTIIQITKASANTIAKVQMWLKLYGEGYRVVIKRTSELRKQKGIEVENFSTPWQKLKRKHSMYFWPQLLLEEIVKTANKKERQRLLGVLSKLKEKTGLNKNLETILRQKL